MNNYWSDLTNKLDPYEPGEQPQDSQYIKLNTNENPYPPSPRALQAMADALGDRLRLYPDPESKGLKQAIADHYQVPAQRVFTGNGSDEVLAVAFMAFFKNKPAIAFPEITYSFYPVYCKLFEIDYNTFALNENFEIDIDAVDDDCGGVIFPNPNAPTGIFLERRHIEALLQKFPDRLLVVDEAYIDFGGQSCVPLTSKYPNLLVIQTLSKSRSLAGMRVGFAVGQEDLIKGMERVKNSFNSYPLDALAIAGATAAIEDNAYFQECCEKIIDTREWITARLGEMNFQVLPSKTNFVFARHPDYDAAKLYDELKRQGILVRHFNPTKIREFLRISIGTRGEMERFCETVADILQAN